MTCGLWCRASFLLNISSCCHFWVTVRNFITSIFQWACRGFIFQSSTRKSCCQLWFFLSVFRFHIKKKGQSLNQQLSILKITLRATVPCHSTEGTWVPSYSYQNQLSLERWQLINLLWTPKLHSAWEESSTLLLQWTSQGISEIGIAPRSRGVWNNRKSARRVESLRTG